VTDRAGEPDRNATGSGWRRPWLKPILRWSVAAVIVWLLFRRVPLAEALLAAQRADLWTFVPAAVAVVLLRFWIDAATLGYLVTRFHTPLSGPEARRMYAVVSVVNMVNWGLGVAALLRELRRSKGIALSDSTSTTFFSSIVGTTVKIGVGLAGIAVLWGDATLRGIAWPVALLFLGDTLALAALMSRYPRWRWLMRLRGLRLLGTTSRATARDLLVVAALRILSTIAFIFFAWIGLHAFAVDVPPLYLLATIPVVLFIGGLPITPAGLGTQQAAMLYFYRSFGAEADILAFGLLYPIVFMLARLAVGGLHLLAPIGKRGTGTTFTA
jgi:uncharacterized membrane protein YbhN (UPF0104 family)